MMSAAVTARSLFAVTLVVAAVGSSACKKSGDALLLVSISSVPPLSDVVSVKAIVRSAVDGGAAATSSATYVPDGGKIAINQTPVSLGVVVPGDVGRVTVKVEAFGGGSAATPIASGDSEVVVPHGGETTVIQVQLLPPGVQPAVDGGDGTDATGAAGASGGGAGQGGAGQGGAGGSSMCHADEVKCVGAQPFNCGTDGFFERNGAACAEPMPTCDSTMGACTCQGTKCPDVCVSDLNSDTHHCGACEVDCKIGSCATGQCIPVVLVKSTGAGPRVLHMAVDQTNIYWVDYMGVWKAGLDGSNPTPIATVSDVAYFAWSAGNVYVGIVPVSSPANGSILKYSVSGAGPVTIASGVNLYGAVAVHGAYVYWGTSGAVLTRAPTAGGGAQTPVATSPMPFGPRLAVDDTNAYWNDQNGTIWKVPVGGGTPTQFSTYSASTEFIIDATNMYLVTYSQLGSVVSVPLDGSGGGNPLATVQSFPGGLVLDGAGSIYWGTSLARLAKTSIAGGGSVTGVSVNTGTPHEMAVDTTSLYWIYQGQILKAAKF